VNGLTQKGFTLVEVIVVMVLLAIVMTIAIPSFMTWQKNLALSSIGRDIVAGLRQAKSTAVSSNTNVVARFVTGAYAPEGGVGSFAVFVDDGAGGGTAGNGLQDGEEHILVHDFMPKSVSLTSTDFGGSVTFNNRGFASSSGTITLKNPYRERQITFTVAGAVSLQ